MADHPAVPTAVTDRAVCEAMRTELGRRYPHRLEDLRTDVSALAAVVLDTWLERCAPTERVLAVTNASRLADLHGAVAEALALLRLGRVGDAVAVLDGTRRSQPRVEAANQHPWFTERADDPAAVRAWAREHGWTVAPRGRLSRDVVAAYEQARVATPADVAR